MVVAAQALCMNVDDSSLVWSWMCAPHLAAAVASLAVMLSASLVQGDRVVRIGVICLTTAVAPWALATAVAICATDPATAVRLHQLASGPTMLVGPSLLVILLSVAGQLERYRGLAGVSVTSGLVLMLIAWSTPLFLTGVYLIPSGFWYPTAGSWLWLHAVHTLGWSVAGLVIAQRASPALGLPSVLRYLAMLPALAIVGTADTLLAYQVGGVMPFSWLPALLGAILCLHLIFRTDLLRSRGLDQTAVIGLLGSAMAFVLVSAVLVTAGSDVEPLLMAALSAPIWGVVLFATWMIPERALRSADSSLAQVLEEFAHSLSKSDRRSIAEQLGALWQQHAQLTDVRVCVDVEALAADTRIWLRSLAAPVMGAEIATMRLGPCRSAIEAMFAANGAAVVVPIVDRGELLAVVEAGQLTPRSLRDAERLFLFDSAQLVGSALTYNSLVANAQMAAISAREVELANELSAQYRPLVDDDLGPWRMTIDHRRSAHPGGEGWSWSKLSGGRIAAMIAESDPQGVAGALVIAALQGAFAARSCGSTCSAAELLAALRDTVSPVGRRTLVLVLDPVDRTVSWASDGHRGAAIVSPQGVTQLVDLSDATAGVLPLPSDSLVILMSCSVLALPGVASALTNGLACGLRLGSQLIGLGDSDPSVVADAGKGGAYPLPRRDLLTVVIADQQVADTEIQGQGA
jgi:GAF domain-containing protein